MKPKISNPMFWISALLIISASACTLGSTPETSQPVTAVPTSPVGGEQAGAPPVNLPAKEADQAGDINSSVDATKKQVPGGDNFVLGQFERPFNANTMDKYFPYLDIVEINGYIDDTWGYANITMSSTDANGNLPAKYAVELDLDKDGRGDWLIMVSNPSSKNWSTAGVQAWTDTNGDVGGVVPLVADTRPTGGDGYETLVFDQGKNQNTDGAWARIDPNDPKTVTLAFKLSMLGSPKSYAMGGWAGSDALSPAMFDFNDHMTHAQAGSPNPGDQVYPIMQLAEIDNTCRLAIGFAATSKTPGTCSYTAPSKPGQQPGGPAPCTINPLTGQCG